MKAGSIPFFLLLTGAIFITLLSSTGCANIIPPSGGPKDTLPPVPVSITPTDSTINFTGKKITLGFNEYVQLDNVQQNLLVNPTPKIPPLVEAKLRTITVTIKDTLDPNTTYSYDFGNAIKDINEGNALKNFTYIFSTGKTIDTLSLSGKVMMAETGKTDSTLIVVLHTSLADSAVVNERPRYIARVDGKGHFRFHNLPAGTFAIYALKDEGGSGRYSSPKQLFAFADAPVNTIGSPPVTLYAYLEKEPPDTARKTFTKPPAPKAQQNKEQEKKLPLQTNIGDGKLDLLSNVEFNFKTTPLKYFDSSKVILTNDSLQPLNNYHFKVDSNNTLVTLRYAWTENTPYRVIIDKDFAEDTTGRKLLKSDTLSFTTKRESEYGAVKLRFLNLDLDKNPVLEFVKSDKIVYTHVFTNNQFNARLFQPGEYDLRILYDDNKNGVWDPGDFFGKHQQPEKVILLSRKLTVKANWDNIVDITL